MPTPRLRPPIPLRSAWPAPNARALLILDGLGWHASVALKVPSSISLLPLPPNSSEFSPAEIVWQYLRQNWLSLVVEVLDELGYQAVEAADGPPGLKLLQSRRRIDLLITDVGLAGINGRHPADEAREAP